MESDEVKKTPIEDDKEEKLINKLRAKRRVRGFLIAINFILVAYLTYGLTMSVIGLVKSINNVEGVVSICDKNQKDSLKIYSQYVTKNTYQSDFVIYGDYLYFSDGYFNYENPQGAGKVQMIKIESEKENIVVHPALLGYEINQNLSSGINLFYNKGNEFLKPGDYLFYHNYQDLGNIGETIKITNQLNMKYVSYSLPDENGNRIQATVYAYKNNPAFVLNITWVKELPLDYYDVVIVGEYHFDYDFSKLKVLEKEQCNVSELRNFNTRNIIINSGYQNNAIVQSISTFKLIDNPDNSYTKSLDSPILELAGYAKSRGFEDEFYNEHYQGKMTYLVNWTL